jgi:DNA-binding Lrp family transcriptional regulator
MAQTAKTALRDRLIEEWQRDLPLTSRPFAVVAEALGARESDVLSTLRELKSEGLITRVGGVVRPNTIGASTLAALAAPDLDVGAIATMLTCEPGINHVYLRENDWNLWFVVTGPDRAYVHQVLQRVMTRTRLTVLDLALETPYHIDLGFSLKRSGSPHRRHPLSPAGIHESYEPAPYDRDLIQVLTTGLPLVAEPFKHIGGTFGVPEAQIIARLTALVAQGVIPRIGVIVRHRALGWRSNAMAVWDVPPNDVDRAGRRLAQAPGVNLCYRRTRYALAWPYNLYCMVHARTRDEALDCIIEAQSQAGISRYPRQILFSLRCYKQTGALVSHPREAA